MTSEELIALTSLPDDMREWSLTKHISVDGTMSRRAYVIMDPWGEPIASVPINFSVALLPHSTHSQSRSTNYGSSK